LKRLIHIGLCLLPIIGLGQNWRVEIQNAPTSIQSGQYCSLFFTLFTPDTVPTDCQARLSLPTGWKILSEKIRPATTTAPFSQQFIYTISAASTAEPKVYDIDFQILTNQNVRTQKRLKMTVTAYRQVEITPLSTPDYVKEGDMLQVEYLVQNLGNQTERLRLATTRGAIEDSKDTLILAPNSHAKVTVKQHIPTTENTTWLAASDLKAWLTEQNVPLFQSVSVPVYTTKLKKNDPFLRFPIYVGGGYLSSTIGNQTFAAYQFHAEGRGYLDFAEQHHLDFLLRGPSQFSIPAIGSFDQYSLEYKHRNRTHVSAGDYILKVNNLMEFARFGRGLQVDHRIGKARLSGFYQQARFFPNQRDAYGGSLGFKLWSKIC
jgi:hypothetical protein